MVARDVARARRLRGKCAAGHRAVRANRQPMSRQVASLKVALLLLSLSAAPAYAQSIPLTMTGTPPTAVQPGERYQFTPTVSDAGGQTLNFRAKGLPDWARFDPSTGYIHGTPSVHDVDTI